MVKIINYVRNIVLILLQLPNLSTLLESLHQNQLADQESFPHLRLRTQIDGLELTLTSFAHSDILNY
jgi:hypothetical protein